MKSIYALIALYLPYAAASANVKDLQVSCHATGKVESVREAVFHPEVPSHFRTPGYSASSGFKAIVKITKLASESCAKLSSKYDMHIEGFTFDMQFGTTPVLKQKEIEAFAQTMIGQTVEFNLNQSFGYQTNGGNLPLFPKVHAESLSFSGGVAVGGVHAGGSIPLPFNISWVYSLKQLSAMSDIEKLALAEEVVPILQQQHFNDFLSLFLQLEPFAPNLKKSYAELIWGLFHKIKASSPYTPQILEFHVGGDGYFYGAPLAQKFNVISHVPNLFSHQDIQDLITEFPEFIVTGSDFDGNCLDFTSADLEGFLHQIEGKIFLLTPSEKWLLKDPLTELSTNTHYGFCTTGKITAPIKTLAAALLNQI